MASSSPSSSSSAARQRRKGAKKNLLTSWPVMWLAFALLRLLGRTYRVERINDGPWQQQLDSGGRVLLCVWHQQLLPLVNCLETYRRRHPTPAVMVSRSSDGELIAKVAKLAGAQPVRGSSSRGGATAFRAIARHLKRHRVAMHTLDGPRGPIGVIKPGVTRIAASAGAVIVPILIEPDRAWFFRKSWDRIFLPKPFARVTIHFGDPIAVPETATKDQLEQIRQDLETLMLPGLREPR